MFAPGSSVSTGVKFPVDPAELAPMIWKTFKGPCITRNDSGKTGHLKKDILSTGGSILLVKLFHCSCVMFCLDDLMT